MTAARIAKCDQNQDRSPLQSEALCLPNPGQAGVCQVLGDREAAVFFTDDVVDLAAKEGVVLVDQALFADPSSPDQNEAAQLRRDIGQAHGVRCRRARAFANRIRCSICR